MPARSLVPSSGSADVMPFYPALFRVGLTLAASAFEHARSCALGCVGCVFTSLQSVWGAVIFSCLNGSFDMLIIYYTGTPAPLLSLQGTSKLCL